MQIHELPTISGSPSGGYFATDNGTQTTKIDYTALAQAIIEQYNASTLAGSAQSVKAALDGLVQKSLPTEIAPRTTIASNDDLNTYTTAGIYRCASATIAASLSNCPVSNVGFNLDVVQLYNTAFAYQRITASTGTGATATVETYERFINVRDSMYGTWKKLPTRAEVDALSAVTTGTFTVDANLENGVNHLSIRQSGKVVTVNGYVSGTVAASTNVNLGTVSGVSMPSEPVRTRGGCGSNAYTTGADAYVSMTTAGKIVCYAASAATNVYFSFSYVAS